MKEPTRYYRRVTVENVAVFESDERNYPDERKEIIYEQKFETTDLKLPELVNFLNQLK